MTLVVVDAAAHRHDDYDLDAEALAALWRMEERHFWHRARNRFILKELDELAPPARVLEVGCGSGAVSSALVRAGYRVVGVDTALVLVQKADARCPEATFVAGPLEQLSDGERDFDAVGFFDVLEHLDDPEALLRAAMARLKPGGLVLATVPALQRLFSSVDEAAGHKRRYEPGELAALFERAGLSRVRERGIFRAIRALVGSRRQLLTGERAPLTAAERRQILVADARVPAWPVNAGLALLCALEARFGWQGSLGRAGASLLAAGYA